MMWILRWVLYPYYWIRHRIAWEQELKRRREGWGPVDYQAGRKLRPDEIATWETELDPRTAGVSTGKFNWKDMPE